MSVETGADQNKEDTRPLTRDERSLVRRLSNALRFADFMALLMVAATAFSALATWRTTQLTRLLLTVSERPYVGMERIAFDGVDGNGARLVIDCRNFGHVSATGGVAQIRLRVDGQPLAGATLRDTTNNVGMISPSVPQLFYRFVPADIYKNIRSGKSLLVAHVLVSYRGPDQRQFCYNEIMTYDSRADAFGSTGGSDQCGGQIF